MVANRLNKILPVPHVVGVDGCPAGWIAAVQDLECGRFAFSIFENFAGLLAAFPDALVIAVDIPIGLNESAVPGGRQCDVEARKLLGRGKTSSVFSAPCRGVLDCSTYAEALRVNRSSSPHGVGLSIQAYNITPKIREVDASMTPLIQKRVIEVHPEVCFRALNGGQAIIEGKKSVVGRKVRRRLLTRNGFSRPSRIIGEIPGKQASMDDIHDAMVACWTARRVFNGAASRIPADPPLDARGLRMEIWW